MFWAATQEADAAPAALGGRPKACTDCGGVRCAYNCLRNRRCR